MVIRPAGRDDAPAILDVWRASELESSVTDSIDQIERVFDTGGLLVATEGGRIVGTLIAAFDGWRGTYYRLRVLESHRRRGIARALLDEGERRLRALGCVRADAIVLRDNEAAVSFWTSAGYPLDVDGGRHVRSL
jgi:ribosomal protein S18 acetylase RimI-like enzyme